MDLTAIHLGPLTPEAVPGPGGTVLATTDRDFSAWDWVPTFLRSGHGHIDRLVLSTFNLGAGVLDSLADKLATEEIAIVDVLLSSELTQLGQGAIYGMLDQAATMFPGRVRWAARHSHAKVVCAWMDSGDCLVVIGSGNLSTHNTRHEAYVVLNSRAAGDHMARWIGALMA